MEPSKWIRCARVPEMLCFPSSGFCSWQVQRAKASIAIIITVQEFFMDSQKNLCVRLMRIFLFLRFQTRYKKCDKIIILWFYFHDYINLKSEMEGIFYIFTKISQKTEVCVIIYGYIGIQKLIKLLKCDSSCVHFPYLLNY